MVLFQEKKLVAKSLKWWELKATIHQRLEVGGQRERERREDRIN